MFRPRDPGLSVIDAVEPAVQRVIAMGVVDPANLGIIGHSWGGFDTAFLATHTKLFKAAVAGAPITDLVSNYGNHHWSSGIAETDHIETGQQRMLVPLYEDLQAYIRNSAIYTAHTMQTALLLEAGDNDGTVHWHQSVALYNIARRAGRNVVMLQYGGEDHGLRKRQNQIDYHHRIFEWFDHHLKGEPAPRWITNGERYLERERDLQQRKLPAKPADDDEPSAALGESTSFVETSNDATRILQSLAAVPLVRSGASRSGNPRRNPTSPTESTTIPDGHSLADGNRRQRHHDACARSGLRERGAARRAPHPRLSRARLQLAARDAAAREGRLSRHRARSARLRAQRRRRREVRR